jgi:uncharacterized protein (DUF4415 family)
MPMVEYTLDTLPELTEERRKELARLDALPANQIDTSDIPELTDEQWAGAVRGRFYRPIKQQITARLDADVLAWLKAGGAGLSNPHERDPAPRHDGRTRPPRLRRAERTSNFWFVEASLLVKGKKPQLLISGTIL